MRLFWLKSDFYEIIFRRTAVRATPVGWDILPACTGCDIFCGPALGLFVHEVATAALPLRKLGGSVAHVEAFATVMAADWGWCQRANILARADGCTLARPKSPP